MDVAIAIHNDSRVECDWEDSNAGAVSWVIKATTALGYCLLQRLASWGHKHLNWPAQHMLSVDAGKVHLVLDLRPCFFQRPVPLRYADPPRMSRISKTSSGGLTAQDHSLGVGRLARQILLRWLLPLSINWWEPLLARVFGACFGSDQIPKKLL